MIDDAELLRRYVRNHSEEAFATLVSRYVDLVYFAALRQADGDAHRAEDVVQTVFARLTRKARLLTGRPSLAGWLHTTTRFAVSEVRRAERRSLSSGVFDLLVASQRYADAARAVPYGQMSARFDMESQLLPGMGKPTDNESVRKSLYDHVVTTALKNIEVLAGAGDLDHAQSLAERLLKFDGSDATRALLLQHATRAGHPELVAELR